MQKQSGDELEMKKSKLLFFKIYEKFYKMVRKSDAFSAYCVDAFGEDFSQDGFSDIEQINRILEFIPDREEVHILDIGCGNGKMLCYLQKKTGAYIHGFDYSSKAIESAKLMQKERAEFLEGIIGEIEYPPELFDVVISMDTMYFTQDMSAFVSQIKKWMKPDGVLFIAYQEGDVVAKTQNGDTTLINKALRANDMKASVIDITRQSYDLLKKKRLAAQAHKNEFIKERHRKWYDILIYQTEYASVPYEEFSKKMARYIYIARK